MLLDMFGLVKGLWKGKMSLEITHSHVGGLMGAYYVFANLVSMPRLGAATSLSIFVCSQVRSNNNCGMKRKGAVGN